MTLELTDKEAATFWMALMLFYFQRDTMPEVFDPAWKPQFDRMHTLNEMRPLMNRLAGQVQ